MVIRTDLGRLTINAGSSSLKVAVFRFEPPDMLEFTVSVAEIGRPHPPRQWGGERQFPGPAWQHVLDDMARAQYTSTIWLNILRARRTSWTRFSRRWRTRRGAPFSTFSPAGRRRSPRSRVHFPSP